MGTLSNLKWKRIVAGGLAPPAASVGLLVVTIVGYTLVASILALGEPDPTALGRFNAVVGTQVFPAVMVLLTVVAAAWVVREVEPEAALEHGLLVGLFVGGVGLVFGAADPWMVVRFAAAIAAGLVGAKLEPTIFGR